MRKQILLMIENTVTWIVPFCKGRSTYCDGWQCKRVIDLLQCYQIRSWIAYEIMPGKTFLFNKLTINSSNLATVSLLSGDCCFAIKVVPEYVAELPSEQNKAECKNEEFQHFPLPFWSWLHSLDWCHVKTFFGHFVCFRAAEDRLKVKLYGVSLNIFITTWRSMIV